MSKSYGKLKDSPSLENSECSSLGAASGDDRDVNHTTSMNPGRCLAVLYNAPRPVTYDEPFAKVLASLIRLLVYYDAFHLKLRQVVVCGIRGKELTVRGRGKKSDHDHFGEDEDGLGYYRDYLCHGCNTMWAWLADAVKEGDFRQGFQDQRARYRRKGRKSKCGKLLSGYIFGKFQDPRAKRPNGLWEEHIRDRVDYSVPYGGIDRYQHSQLTMSFRYKYGPLITQVIGKERRCYITGKRCRPGKLSLEHDHTTLKLRGFISDTYNSRLPSAQFNGPAFDESSWYTYSDRNPLGQIMKAFVSVPQNQRLIPGILCSMDYTGTYTTGGESFGLPYDFDHENTRRSLFGWKRENIFFPREWLDRLRPNAVHDPKFGPDYVESMVADIGRYYNKNGTKKDKTSDEPSVEDVAF